jgi:hypothetical protein
MGNVESLRRLIPPPHFPVARPTPDGWQPVEQRLRLQLPNDYKLFIESYGAGGVDGFLWVFSPFIANKNLNLIHQASVRLDSQRQFAQVTGIRTPYPLYPDDEGLFPWGGSDNGDVLFWRRDSGGNWAVVISDSRASTWEQFDLPICEFLADLLSRRITVKLFPIDFPSEPSRFHSAKA